MINKSLCKNCPLHLVQKQENFHSADSCREGIATGPIHTICRILSWFQAFDQKMFVSPLIFAHLRTLQPTNSIPFKAWDLWLSHEYLRQPWPPKATKVVKSVQGFPGLGGTGLASNSNSIALSCPAMVIIMSSFISLHRFMSLLYAGSWNANASCIAKHAWKYLGFKIQLSQRAGEIMHQKPWDTMGNLGTPGHDLHGWPPPRFMEHNCKLYAKLFYRPGHATEPQNWRQETTDLRPAPNKTEWVNLEPRCTTKSEDGSYGGVAVGRGIRGLSGMAVAAIKREISLLQVRSFSTVQSRCPRVIWRYTLKEHKVT